MEVTEKLDDDCLCHVPRRGDYKSREMTQISPTELQEWLEWAGARLLAMPSPKIKPAEPHVIWPEFSQDKFEVLKFRGGMSLRASAPSKDEIPLVDEILLLPNVCQRSVVRRILHARALVNPINGRYIYNWSRLAKLLQLDRQSVKRQHTNGLIEVVKRAPSDRVCRIHLFFQSESH